MTSDDIMAYYDTTADRKTREDLQYAVDLVNEPRIALDCGCGAGSDIAFLRSKGFTVYAFDIELEAITRCHKRFIGDDKVILSCASFSNFSYPAATLISADASLFFCAEDEFDQVWRKMTDALQPGGIFAGSFLGPKDTMAGSDYDRNAFWPDTLVLTEDVLRPRFSGFKVLKWTEHDLEGQTAQGKPHRWHIFSVVAKWMGAE